MRDRLPFRMLHQSHQRDGDIRQHKRGEREHVTNLVARGRVDVIPLGKGGQRAEREHDEHVVEHAEEHRLEARGYRYAEGHHAKRGEQCHHAIDGEREDGEQHARSDGHEHVETRKPANGSAGSRNP